MRSIVNIDYTDIDCDGAFNSAIEGNELMVCIRPLATQLTNYRVEFSHSNGTVHTSGVIVPSGGLDGKMVEYIAPIAYWNVAGTMKVRLLSDEGASGYALFTCITINPSDDVCCKYDGNNAFMFHLCGKSDPIIDLIYPIGSVITNSKSTFDPNKVYGGTTWERIKGRVIVGVDENDSDFADGKSGGHKNLQAHRHDISIIHDGYHGHSGSSGSDGGHSHSASTSISSTQLRASFACYNMAYVDMHGAGRVSVRQDKVNAWTGHASNSRNFGVWDFNGDHAHSASTSIGASGTHSHEIYIGDGGSHKHDATISNTGTGNAENLQPYVTKYVWERTA